MRFILGPLLMTIVAGEVSAQAPHVLRKPVAEYVAATSEGQENAIVWAQLSPDGKLVACVRQGGKLTVSAIGAVEPLFTAEMGGSSVNRYKHGVFFSADGKLVAFLGKEKWIEIRSTQTGKMYASCELTPRNQLRRVIALAFSPDGKKLAVSSGFLYHMDLHLFETATGKLLGQPVKDVDGFARQLIFSADGKRLVANHSRIVYLVDAVAHRLTTEVLANANAVFFRGDKLFVAREESLTIHEVTDKGVGMKAMGQFAEKKLETRSAWLTVISGEPPVAAIPLKTEVSVRDMEGRERYRVVGEDSPIRSVGLSADGHVLLIYRDSMRVEVFRLD